MPCNQNCNQGRNCNCTNNYYESADYQLGYADGKKEAMHQSFVYHTQKQENLDRATVVVATLLLICFVSIGFGLYKLMSKPVGQPCAVNVKFKDSTATYIGTSV